MERKFRLTRSTDFKRVRQNGKSYAHPLIVLVVRPNGMEVSRVGIAAGRGVGGAVKRNRAKRLIRAAVQANLERISPGWDVLLFARRPMVEATFEQTQAAVLELMRRAQLLRD